jgi:2'-5' RNA ligase
MSEGIIEELAELALNLKVLFPKLRTILPVDAHLTLEYFGDCSDEKLYSIATMLGNRFPHEPFALDLYQVKAFSRGASHVVWADLRTGRDLIHALSKTAHQRTTSLSVDTGITPHVTLGRLKGRLSRSELSERTADFSSSTMLVDRIFLMRARRGDTSKSRYDQVTEIPFGS